MLCVYMGARVCLCVYAVCMMYVRVIYEYWLLCRYVHVDCLFMHVILITYDSSFYNIKIYNLFH